MTRQPSTESLMRHDVPRTSRRRLRWPLSTKPPTCDTCGLAWAPWVDHAECVRPA